MRRLQFVFALLTGVVVMLSSSQAHAQVGYMPYQDRPTLSPWLDLYRDDPGPVGPYLSNVRPQQRLLGTLSQQRMDLQRQGTAVSALQRQLAQPRQTMAGPTGIGAMFMNYSHYFPSAGGMGQTNLANCARY